MHRFKHRVHPRYEATIFPPSTRLHIANINATTTEEDILSAFEAYGDVIDFRFLSIPTAQPGGVVQAVMELDALEAAIHALVMMHNHVLKGHAFCVSFACPLVWP
jgi:hypothetical protein